MTAEADSGRVCARCRHLRGGTLFGLAGGHDAWCPVWRMRVAAPAVIGCTLFERAEEFDATGEPLPSTAAAPAPPGDPPPVG